MPVCPHKVLILTEPNLMYSILSHELGFIEFTFYRKGRSALTSTKQDGGGVRIASHITSEVLQHVYSEAHYTLCLHGPPLSPC